MAASLAVLLTVTLWVDFVLFKLVQTDRSVVKTMGRKALPVEEDLDRIINVPDSQQLPDMPVDPHDSWLLFVEHSEKGVNDRKKNKGRGRKSQHGLPGPPGPPGPQGPPGAVVTQEVLLKEFKEMLKEVVEERNRITLQEKCQECPGIQGGLAFPPLLPREMGPYHRLEAAFYCKLKDDLVMNRKSLRELKNFHIPEQDGVFLRGIGLNLTTGQYVAPMAGFYQFSANLHIEHREHQRRRHSRPHDNIRILICIESLCQHNATPSDIQVMADNTVWVCTACKYHLSPYCDLDTPFEFSLETVYGLDSNSHLFTMFVSGALYLQAMQYISVFVDNRSGFAVTIRSGSDFTGIFLGT